MGSLRQNFLLDQSANVAVIFALAAVPLLAATSAAIDFSKLARERAMLSGALDAAVIAAANNAAISVDKKPDFAEAHFRANYSGPVDFKLTPSFNNGIVTLAAVGELELTFAGTLGFENPTFNQSSSALLSQESTICVLSLSDDADAAISFGEYVEFSAPGCAVHSNSSAPTAISTSNAVRPPVAKSFCAVGGVNGKVEPRAKGECAKVEDPYVDRLPAQEGPCVAEFMYEIGDQLHPVDIAMNAAMAAAQGEESDGTDLDLLATTAGLVDVAPLSLPLGPNKTANEVKTHLETVFGDDVFEDEDDDDEEDYDNDWDDLKKLVDLSGNDLQIFLSLYDLSDGHYHCKGGKRVPECDAFANPYNNKKKDDAPQREVVAEMFDFLYGDYIPDPEIRTGAEILAMATIVYLNGKLYTRDNMDGQLVHISKNLTGGSARLQPGTYCGGLTVDGLNVTFAAGDYIMKDGPLTFLNGSQAKAQDVTFGFKGVGATLNIESGSVVDVKAPMEGPRRGLAFMEIPPDTLPDLEDRVLPGTEVSRITSAGSLRLAGTAYLPNQTLEIEGKKSHLGSRSAAVGIIADRIAFRGQRGTRVMLSVDHVSAGIPPIEPRAEDGARLVK